jgi:hypothetical protein
VRGRARGSSIGSPLREWFDELVGSTRKFREFRLRERNSPLYRGNRPTP